MRVLKSILLLVLLAAVASAAIQYAGGTTVNTTIAADTRALLVANLRDQLITAGWSVISGGGTTDVILQSASTPTANNSIQVRLYDSGAGNASVYMRDAGGTKISTAHQLAPGAAKVFRVIACKYQFFAFVEGATSNYEFAFVTVPYLPSFLHAVITSNFGFLQTNGSVPTGNNLRIHLGSNGINFFAGLVNNSLIDGWAWGSVAAEPSIFTTLSSNSYVQTFSPYRWHDDTLPVSDPFLAWGLLNQGDEPKIRGQLWQSIVVGDVFAGGTTISLDGKTWYAITNSNTTQKATLFTMVP